MNEQVAWELTQSVETEAPASFAWAYWTNISNWNDPPATFEIDGPFREGARGATLIPGEEPRRWRIARVNPGESYVLEMDLTDAKLSFTWRFEPVSEHTSRLTQTITLSGEAAASFAGGLAEAFGPNLAPGMDRIATAIGCAAARQRRH